MEFQSLNNQNVGQMQKKSSGRAGSSEELV